MIARERMRPRLHSCELGTLFWLVKMEAVMQLVMELRGCDGGGDLRAQVFARWGRDPGRKGRELLALRRERSSW